MKVEHIEIIRDEGDGPDIGKLMIICRDDEAKPEADGSVRATQILVPLDRDMAAALYRDLGEFLEEAERARDLN